MTGRTRREMVGRTRGEMASVDVWIANGDRSHSERPLEAAVGRKIIGSLVHSQRSYRYVRDRSEGEFAVCYGGGSLAGEKD